MQYRYVTADVFASEVFGGNPLAVFPQAQGLDDRRMQLVAREMNLSETAFVLPPSSAAATRALRIFTPRTELPFAGHPTIGAALVLGAIGEIASKSDVTRVVFEEGVGPVEVSLRGEGGRPRFATLSAAQLPKLGPPPPDVGALARMLTLGRSDLLAEDRIEAISCGVPFLFVPVRDEAALARARLDAGAWHGLLASYWAPHVYVFVPPRVLGVGVVRARMFAPAMGIEEDPATGAAAAALAGYLVPRDARTDPTIRWTIRQGVEMGRSSVLELEAEREGRALSAVRVGGSAVLVSQGVMEVPEAGA
jgi:trans-2,3-dihydro-3-hydroxyanthranilate isomerase